LSKKPYIMIGIILLILAIFPLYRFLGASKGDNPDGPLQTAQVENRDLGETVLASGLVRCLACIPL
jgi:hypothetical protein